MNLLNALASDEVLDSAYGWLCKQRRAFPANADIWAFRFAWAEHKAALREDLLAGRYRFAPLSRVTKRDGETIHLWSSRDALVLKALSMVLAEVLPVSSRCVHVKGHGGLKAAVRDVQAGLASQAFVFRTDVRAFYESIDHFRLLEQLAEHVKDRAVLNLLWQSMRRTVEWGGLYRDINRGLARGSALSPLLGAVYLQRLDQTMAALGVFYVRYMDDIVVLAPKRWILRRAVKRVNEALNNVGMEKHPDKTFVGRIERGFDFLGYHFSRGPLRVASKTVSTFVSRLHRLYEQQRTAPDGAVRVGDYVTRWLRWTRAGLWELHASGQAPPVSHAQAGKAQTKQG